MSKIVAFIFGASLFMNAFLFVPQVIKTWRTKSAKDLSVITLLGFLTIQLSGCIHGYFQKDFALMIGLGASLLSCGTVTVLAIVYRKG